MADIRDYLKRRIVGARLARLIGEIVVALGVIGSLIALFFGILALVVVGFSLLFAGLYPAVRYELQRLGYANDLERFTQREKQ